MPTCEVTGISQMALIKCIHPKYENKYVGYKTCSEGLCRGSNGQAVRKGQCPHFITGSSTLDNWCGLRKENKDEKHTNRLK